MSGKPFDGQFNFLQKTKERFNCRGRSQKDKMPPKRPLLQQGAIGVEATPQPKEKRLPRILSGTAEAKERKKEKQRERQARRRERLRQERHRRHPSTSSESDRDHPISGVGEAGDFHAGDVESEAGTPAPFRKQGPEDTVMLSRNLVTEQTPTEYRPSRKDLEDDEVADLVSDVVRLKVKSNVSDAALDEMFRIFYRRHDTLVMLKERKLMAPNYTNGVRPYATDRLLDISCSLLLKEENPARGTYYRRVEGLKTIPAEYLNLPHNSRTKLLRMETSVKLRDIKAMYKESHGNGRQVQSQLLACDLSADGVAQSKSGARTFVVVTVRIGSCIYVTRIFNHLVGVEESKATALELLR